MILIIGGMAQGKRAFAEERFGMGDAESWTDGEKASWEQVLASSRCHGLHLLFRRLLKEGGSLEGLEAALFSSRPERVLVADEIGCGLVPMDREERRIREETGRALCRIAARCDQVWRVTCGLGQRIK